MAFTVIVMVVSSPCLVIVGGKIFKFSIETKLLAWQVLLKPTLGGVTTAMLGAIGWSTLILPLTQLEQDLANKRRSIGQLLISSIDGDLVGTEVLMPDGPGVG